MPPIVQGEIAPDAEVAAVLPLFYRPGAERAARIAARTILAYLHWDGPQHIAVGALCALVHNALTHGEPKSGAPVKLRRMNVLLRIGDERELVIDVPDFNPDFPDFDAAVRGERGGGLRDVRAYGGEVTWLPAPAGEVGKIVRVSLRPGPVDL
ncbi:hypothetical protein ACGFRB_28970 [Streptomyces sp. NPDC048718]|uniref:hypothetical protein n=1 Tax=Streptomyces sp. NPDC048718 TaxID=3365587 RepID=UPI00372252AF